MVLGGTKDSSLISFLVGGGRDITWLSIWSRFRAGVGFSIMSGRVRGSSLVHYLALVRGGRDITQVSTWERYSIAA